MLRLKHWPKEQSELYFLFIFDVSCNMSNFLMLYHSVSVNYVNPNDNNRTPLQACLVSQRGDGQHWFGIETAELLILNGAKLNNTANNDESILDTALQGNADQEMVQYLIARIN